MSLEIAPERPNTTTTTGLFLHPQRFQFRAGFESVKERAVEGKILFGASGHLNVG